MKKKSLKLTSLTEVELNKICGGAEPPCCSCSCGCVLDSRVKGDDQDTNFATNHNAIYDEHQ